MSAFNRFLGDTPLRVAVKLTIASFLMGVALVWLDLHPRDVFTWIGDGFRAIWNLGAESFEYLALGAAVVVPIFLVMRLLSWRGAPRD